LSAGGFDHWSKFFGIVDSNSFRGLQVHILGFYTGSPFFNTNYILDHLNIVKEYDDFFRYLIPTRLFHGDLMQQQLPDLSSPSGLFGSALMLGEIYLAMI
jgi:hypothetical protein